MRPTNLNMDIAAVDTDGLAATNASDNVTSTMTLDGALTSGGTFTSADGLGRQIVITDTATQDQSDSTFGFVGTDADGKAQVEDLAGPTSGSTAVSLKYYKTISAITVTGGDGSDTVSIGTNGLVASKTIPLDAYMNAPAVIQAEVVGTVTFTVEATLYNPLAPLTGTPNAAAAPFDFTDQGSVIASDSSGGLHWMADGNWTTKSADLIDDLATGGVRAIRVTTASYTATAEIQLHIVTPY